MKKPLKDWQKVQQTFNTKHPMLMTLSELLELADQLFPTYTKPKLTCFNYSLNRMPYGWGFNVVNSWQKWVDKKFEHQFGYYKQPEYAITAFLKYVVDNKIVVTKLYET